MAIGDAALERVGRTPEARVRRLLAYAGWDLARRCLAAQRRVWDAFFALQSHQAVRVPVHAPTLAETQEALRAAIDALANGRPCNLWVPGMTWTLTPPAAQRRRSTRHSAPITRESVESPLLRPAMPAAVVLTLVDDLNRIGADRLRACPLEDDGRRCGVVFLATRRQRFCSRRHTQAAAWQTYAVKRKLRRR
jgi:hypothetical protein